LNFFQPKKKTQKDRDKGADRTDKSAKQDLDLRTQTKMARSTKIYNSIAKAILMDDKANNIQEYIDKNGRIYYTI
jgi:hypothetical protein